MADGSHIEWTDATWNPITGCSVISPGCANCYAMRLAGTRLKDHPSRAGLTAPSKAGPVWTGEVRFNEQWLNQPLRWTKPRRIFVCAHGDLFHENVPDEWIYRVFAVMALCPQHTFQVLTKRITRAHKILNAVRRPGLPEGVCGAIARMRIAGLISSEAAESGYCKPATALPNVWLGASAEDQPRFDERVGQLLQIPAAKRFVSLEPLIAPIDIGWTSVTVPGLDWVIVGGESGPGARPMHPQWVRDIRDECDFTGTAFFFKQWGEFAPTGEHLSEDRPEFLRLRTGRLTHVFDDLTAVAYVGKKAAGRELDGDVHNAMPRAA